jgi:deazaflavin-dependent oxidoreductase (nitroreductase family)
MMFGQLIMVMVAVAAVMVAVAAAVFLGVRARVSVAVDLLRRFSRLFNPFQMRTAGQPGAYAAVIRHRGRTSGRAYATPVGAVATDDGFLIALPYGMRSNWLRNVLASGSASIVHDGKEHPVCHPEVIPLAQVATRFPPSDQRSFRLFGVDRCLRLQRADAGAVA